MRCSLFTVLLVIIGSGVGIFSQVEKAERIRTPLTEKTCVVDESAKAGDGILGTKLCKGAAGYKVAITFLEHGQWVKLRSPDGKELYLELFEPMGVESYVGNEIEWRLVRNGDSVNVKAMMFKRKVIRRGYSEEKPRTKIAVFKIMSDAACLIADLNDDELNKSLDFADNPERYPCYSEPGDDPDDPSDTSGEFELPTETNFADEQKKRLKYFYDEKSEWETLAPERLYPIGWSKDGKFAYLVEPADIACDCYFATVAVKDFRTNKTLWKFDHEEPLDPSDKSYETGDTQHYRAAFWKKNQKVFSEKLNSYGIILVKNSELLRFPFKHKNEVISANVELTRDEKSDYGYPQNLSKIEVKLTSNQTKTKKLFEENFETRDTFSYVEDADVFGYFQSPFEPLIAIVIVKVGRGQHGMSPNPTSVEILGFNVGRGLD